MNNKMYRKYIFHNLVQNTCLYLKNYISSPIKANVKLLHMNGNCLMHKCKLNTAFIGSVNLVPMFCSHTFVPFCISCILFIKNIPTMYTDGGTPRCIEYVCNMCQPVQGIIKGFNNIKLEVPKVYIHDCMTAGYALEFT